MKKFFYAFILLLFCACSSYKNALTETSTQEEMSLGLVMLNEQSQSVLGSSWLSFGRCLSVSPDEKNLCYLSRIGGIDCVVIRDINNKNNYTQRTNRASRCPFWGINGEIYFSDISSSYKSISSVSCDKGTLIRQYTNNSSDHNPVLSKDGNKLFFERYYGSNTDIWSIDLKTNVTTLCTRGECPYPVDKKGKELLCIRDNSIWLIDYVEGKETLILKRNDMRFYAPMLSPNGDWIVCTGLSTKDANMDIYVVKIDGSELTRLTYHKKEDFSPVWGNDGKVIYFISSRSNTSRKFNIWSLNFPF